MGRVEREKEGVVSGEIMKLGNWSRKTKCVKSVTQDVRGYRRRTEESLLTCKEGNKEAKYKIKLNEEMEGKANG